MLMRLPFLKSNVQRAEQALYMTAYQKNYKRNKKTKCQQSGKI